jgi:DNA repair protein RadC
METIIEDPRFRILNHSENASFTDLIAVLLSHGHAGRNVMEMSQEIVQMAGSESGLVNIDPDRLKSIKGVGRARTAAILAAIELARRFRFELPKTGEKFSPYRLSRLLLERYRGIRKESLLIFSFNKNLRLIQHTPLARGGADSVYVPYREIIKILLNDSARFALLAHNHPNDASEAGISDRTHTREIEALMRPLGVSLIDHYICGTDGIFSVKENKIIYTDGDKKMVFIDPIVL